MKSARRELIGVLLEHVRSPGLISDLTYSRAMDLVHSAADFPDLFQVPVCSAEEANGLERAQDTQ